MKLTEILLLILGIQVSNIFILLFMNYLSHRGNVTINPVKAYQEHKREEEMSKEDELKELQMRESLENIDIYNGTELGQKNITRSL